MKTVLRITILLNLMVGCTPITPLPVQPSTTPAWTTYPPLRAIENLGPVVTDIESHLYPGHPYRDNDRVNWVHEGTQGIAGQLRDQYHQPGFYVLENRAILMQEPAITLAQVAAQVPTSLRGRGYDLYLVQWQAWFQKQPTYVFDEWTAYTNGSEARFRWRIAERGETVESMMEFIPYALCVPKAARSQDAQMRAFIRWQIERAMILYRISGVHTDTLDRFRTTTDAEALRQFTRGYLGADWTHRSLGL